MAPLKKSLRLPQPRTPAAVLYVRKLDTRCVIAHDSVAWVQTSLVLCGVVVLQVHESSGVDHVGRGGVCVGAMSMQLGQTLDCTQA